MQLITCPWCGRPRRDRVPLRRPGPRRLPGRPGRAHRRRMGRVRVLPRQPQGRVPRALGALGRLPALVQRACATPPTTGCSRSTGSGEPPPRGRRHDPAYRTPGGRVDRDRPLRVHLQRGRLHRACRRHARLGPARQRRAPDRAQHQVRPPARHHRGRRRGVERARAGRGALPRADAHRADGRAGRRAGRARPGRARAAGRTSPTRPATTRCTRTASCSSSAPARPAWPPRSPAPGPARG